MKLLLLVMGISLISGLSAFAQDTQGDSSRILIAYFSKTDNTRTVAEQIHSRIGGTMFHVKTLKPYPEEYRETTRMARGELDKNMRPALAATIPVEEMNGYDTIFIGYPNWWGTIPMVMFTFLEQYDLAGKTIVPFCTHEGSGLGRGPDDITRIAPEAKIREGFDVRGGSVRGAQSAVDAWLRALGYIQ